MKIALIAHDRKKTLMIKLATAYKHILEKHELYATGTTGMKVMEATGLPVNLSSLSDLLVAVNQQHCA